jgi:nicotinamidase-related amidase
MMAVQPLPLPPHHDPAHARDPGYFVANAHALHQAAVQWREQQRLKPAVGDATRVHLLVIDPQFDFSFPGGTLFVGGRSGAGAMEDSVRVAQFVYRHLHVLSEITCTMDSHLPYQVFYPTAHLRDNGSHPEPFSVISTEQYQRGEYRANPAMARHIGADPVWLQRQFVDYCQKLEQTGKYQLTLWPYHCLVGSHGHQLAGAVDEARLFHAFARGAANVPEIKGGNPLTEHYSIFQPEVMTTWDGRPIPGVQKNTRLIETLLRSDMVIVTGEAASHCLAWTIDDLLTHILANDPTLARKVYILRDCTSAVVIPGVVDYTDQAEAAFARFQDAGMHLVQSTDPIDSWPGANL